MLLLNNLNEVGFQKLKEDREVLLNEINHLQSILSQFDLAYPFLSSIFEPEVEIKYHKTKDLYVGYFRIEHPNFNIPIFKFLKRVNIFSLASIFFLMLTITAGVIMSLKKSI